MNTEYCTSKYKVLFLLLQLIFKTSNAMMFVLSYYSSITCIVHDVIECSHARPKLRIIFM
jgi:hypothetical protein